MGIDHQREEGAVSARIRKLRLDAATVLTARCKKTGIENVPNVNLVFPFVK
jgi:hypothetical protein